MYSFLKESMPQADVVGPVTTITMFKVIGHNGNVLGFLHRILKKNRAIK